MYTKNSQLLRFLIIISIGTGLMVSPSWGQSEVFQFSSSKGLRIKIIQNEGMNFLHARLVLFYDNAEIDPFIPYLTMLNLFDEDVVKTTTSLLASLQRLGSDYLVTHHPDHLSIQINFLSDRIPAFTQFLKELFSYRSFTLKRFNTSLFNYRRLLKKYRGWEKKLAQQAAYSILFPDHLLGNTLIPQSSLPKINLAQIRSFYRSIYQPQNGILIIKGNLNPHLTFGLIEKGLKSLKSRNPRPSPAFKIPAQDFGRKIVILNMASNEAPFIFWFQVIPPVEDANHLPSILVNNIMFGWPIGKLFRAANGFGIRSIKRMDTHVFHHKGVAVICNSIRLNYEDLEKFILLADHETRRLSIQRIERKEYLEMLNYFMGKTKVESERFDEDVRLEVKKTMSLAPNGNLRFSRANAQQVTLNQINRFIGANPTWRRSDTGTGATVIIIGGNAKTIRRYVAGLKLDLVFFP